MAGIGFDVVVVGDLRRAGVPHPTAAADFGHRMLVAQRHIVHRAAGQRVLQAGQPDQRGLGGIGVEHVDAAVGDQHPGDPVGRQAVEHVGNQVGRRRFGSPWRRDDLQAGPDLVDAGPVEHLDVGRAFGGEQRTGVHRRRVQRVVVAGQQVDRNPDGAHGFQRLTDHLRRQLVVFEDVTGHHDELGAHLGRQRAQTGHCVAAGRRIPRLRFAREEVTGHAELPVGGVHESHCDPVPSASCPAGLRPGTASVGPAPTSPGTSIGRSKVDQRGSPHRPPQVTSATAVPRRGDTR